MDCFLYDNGVRHERVEKALHHINMITEEKVFSVKNERFKKKTNVFFCNPALSLLFPTKKWQCRLT